MVALTVLCGIAGGAVLTLLHGPWMWGSLLLLPALSALAVFLLFHLDDSRLRRSLQLAIILSLAAHLLVLVSLSVVNIFQNPFEQPERKVAQRQERTIEISDRRAQFVWEQPNAQETPEPQVETERQKKTTTNNQPQPVPVKNTKPEFKPQLVRRETPARSVPRQDKSLSQLRRQERNLQPKSSQQSTGQQAAASQSSSQSAQTSREQASSEKAVAVERQSASASPRSDSPAKKSATNPTPNERKQTPPNASSPRRTEIAERTVEAAQQSSSSSARVPRRSPNVPLVQRKSLTSDKKATSNEPLVDPTPSPASTQITRRPTRSQTERPASTQQPETQLSPKSQIARSVERRKTNNLPPSVSSPTSREVSPRRSVSESALAASPIAIEKPSREPDSRSAANQLNSKTLSVSRSATGVAGAGQSQNMARATGGMASPATRPSDSALRRRTESRPTENRMLTSSQKATVRRSSGAALTPKSAFKADTSQTAKIAGSQTPLDQTVESSAANINSASADHRSEISAERGTTSVDTGPTKVVMDRESPRRSGGGQPEVSELNPESTRRSRASSNQQPLLAADTGAESVAPSSVTSATPTSELEPSNEANAMARQGGEAPNSTERDSATTPGDFSTQGESEMATELADARQRASRADESGAEFFDEEDEDEEEERRGRQESRIAQAPITRRQPGVGSSRTGEGQALAKKDSESESPGESLAANLQRQATSVMPGAGIGRSAANLLVQAATSLPIIESSATRRNDRPAAGTNSSESGNESAKLAAKLANKTPGMKRSNTAPKTANAGTSNLPTSKSGKGNASNLEIDSASVAMERTESSDQEQGAALEVIAMEGPTGLADRPDEALGIMTRPSSRESEQIQPDLDNRFRNPDFGGTPAVNPDAVLAKDAFRQRSPSSVANAVEPSTEAAIHLGLEFLARYQSPDGSWSLSGFDQNHPDHINQLNSDAAATGLALLAFQGAGYNHREFKYARQMNHALQWLIENQQDDGSLYVPADKKSNESSRMYSHGIAALALTEAYGMTQDLQIKDAAQKALDYIRKSQDPRKGGWRYFDQPKLKSTDTSVTGWMMMAMQSGRLAGLEVPTESFDLVDQWLEVAADPDDASKFRYSPYVVDSEGRSRIQGTQPTASMTAVALLMQIYSGWDRDDPRLLDGATYLLQTQMPTDSTPRQRDTYYWYYATQVLKHIDGPLWEKWDAQLRPLLIRSQAKSGDLAGSWHPYNPVRDRWGAFGGRLYVTTMNLLSLEVRHRMLPLYKKTNAEEDNDSDSVNGGN